MAALIALFLVPKCLLSDMSSRQTNLDKTTQTDLLYGLALTGNANVSTLEALPDAAVESPAATDSQPSHGATLAGMNAQADAISQNAATRADSSLTGQISHDANGTVIKKHTRWRYLDGIAPPEEIKAIAAPQFIVTVAESPKGYLTWGRSLWNASYAGVLSCLVHLMLIGCLVMISTPAWESTWIPAMTGHQPELVEPLEVVQRQDPEVALPTEVEFTTSTPVTMELSVPEPDVDKGGFQGIYAIQPLLASANLSGPIGDVQQLFGELGQGKSQSGAGKGGAEFFGTKAVGNKFAFVVDCSLSMQGERWIQACEELLASIDRLKPEQLFYVVLFDGGVHRMFNHDDREAVMFPATAENKERFRQWLATARLGPETRPFLSMKCALELRPDAIYLLSDGDFTDPTAVYLNEVNRPASRAHPERSQVVIHTINFHGPRDQVIMKRIARENRGKYIYVGSK